jgi:hypothetical protein
MEVQFSATPATYLCLTTLLGGGVHDLAEVFLTKVHHLVSH